MSVDTEADAAMPPCPASNDFSCSAMVSAGFAADNKVAPCGRLLGLPRETGIHTNLAFLCKGKDASHRWPQCGHCGSDSTYTVAALMMAPTVKPLPCAVTASSGLLAAAAGASCLEQPIRVSAK